MGAQSFAVTAEGDTLQKAFAAAQIEAAFWHGHGPDSGTIAEKSSVRLIAPPANIAGNREALMDWASDLLYDDDLDPHHQWIQDKWAPAAAVPIGPQQWLFFGYATT